MMTCRFVPDCKQLIFETFMQDGAPALIIAAQRGHAAVVKLLLEEGANSEAPNKVVTHFMSYHTCRHAIDDCSSIFQGVT